MAPAEYSESKDSVVEQLVVVVKVVEETMISEDETVETKVVDEDEDEDKDGELNEVDEYWNEELEATSRSIL